VTEINCHRCGQIILEGRTGMVIMSGPHARPGLAPISLCRGCGDRFIAWIRECEVPWTPETFAAALAAGMPMPLDP
jgi:hypothetical protein